MTQRAAPGAEIPSLHYILLGTFRHPVIYTLSFNPYTRCLKHHGETLATGGHSWLNQSPDGSTVYATVWNQDAPRLAAYRITSPKPCLVASPSRQRSEAQGESLTLDLINECELDHLSGCVCANATTVFSASGPQCDVIPIDASTGGFASPIAAQSLAFVDLHAGSEQGHQRIIGADKAQSFGGLRHGGHSTELSPDGTKFYVADIGRNCVWIYQVSGSQPSRLTLLSQYRSRRLNDGPRHTWPHPNGRIVYCVQEHSSVVDVLEHEGDDLVWRQGAKILPEHKSCSDFWADEVRTDPLGRVLFGSTRGLAPTERGYLCAWPLLENGWINLDASGDHRTNTKVSMDNIPACHTLQTPTSGGWANAISVCAALGPRGETWLTLTDSEEGHLWIVSWTEEAGFEIVQDFQLPKDGRGDAIGASVGIWIM